MTASTSPEQFTLQADDGYPLAATRYPAQGKVMGNLLMASATGVPQRFYRRFAEHASQRGFSVLTLDYRGIGDSKPATLKGFDMAYLDWALLDLKAAVDYLGQDEQPLYWMGHSFGGHALGLLPNQTRISAACCFGTGAGWAGWMPRLEALKVRLMWNGVLPLLVRAKGYLAWSMLGMGEDLPRGVYRDWRHWCSFPRYFFDDPQMVDTVRSFADVRMPCLFANAEDDLWALPRSRDAFIAGYCNAPLERRDLPVSAGQAIGHMGYFRPALAPLWDEALDWLLAQEASAEAQLRSGTQG